MGFLKAIADRLLQSLRILAGRHRTSTMSSANQIQVTFLPWLEIHDEIRIGPVTFWPFEKMKKAKIQNPQIADFLTDYFFTCYKDYDGTSLRDITVCSHGAVDFKELGDAEVKDVRNALNALIFISISGNLASGLRGGLFDRGAEHADGFQVFGQNLDMSQRKIGVSRTNITIFPESFDSISFLMPFEAVGAKASVDDDLAAGFGHVLEPARDDGLTRRIVLILEWFRMAHTQMGATSPEAELVMLATALEIALDIGRATKKKELIAHRLQRHVADKAVSDFIVEQRYLGPGLETPSRVACWGYDFYELRNRIVHGDSVAPDEMIYEHADIGHSYVACAVLRDLLIREMFEKNMIGERARAIAREWTKRLRCGRDFASIARHHFELMMRFDAIYARLGWLE